VQDRGVQHGKATESGHPARFFCANPTAFSAIAENRAPERLNSDLKRAIGKRPSPRSDAELEHNVRSHLKSVQLKPDKICGFFGSKTTAYAA
jgi:hypothetical protein